MSDMTTEADYRDSVTTYAKLALSRSRDGEELSDVIHEIVDSSCWVIYTWRARLVCQWSKNEDAFFDENGNLVQATNACELWQSIAFWALRADVTQAVDELADEDEEVQL